MRGGKRAGAGRKPVYIDLVVVEKASMHQLNNAELGAVVGVSEKTIETRRKDPEFDEAIVRGKAKGRVLLRRTQMRLAETHVAMSIWLGKQYLGQKDVVTEPTSAQSRQGRITIEDIDALLNGKTETS